MEAVILVRHAESTFSVRDSVNGDPDVPGGGLTDAGRAQAWALGRLLAEEPLELAVTSEFARTKQTADLALADREVPRLVLADLNDIRFGAFEGRTLEEYRGWALGAGPADASPGGGESRVEAARRFVRGFRRVLERPERLALVVAHSLPVRYALNAAGGRDPAARVEAVGYAVPHRLRAAELAAAADRLERWCEHPAFA